MTDYVLCRLFSDFDVAGKEKDIESAVENLTDRVGLMIGIILSAIIAAVILYRYDAIWPFWAGGACLFLYCAFPNVLAIFDAREGLQRVRRQHLTAIALNRHALQFDLPIQEGQLRSYLRKTAPGCSYALGPGWQYWVAFPDDDALVIFRLTYL